MNSRSLNKILTKIPTELCDFIFAAYNLHFVLPRVVCLHLYAKGQCMQHSTALFYLPFYIRDSSIAQKTCPRSLRSLPF